MYLVGIAGGSGSGKTTFVKKILKRLHELRIKPRENAESEVCIIHQDAYYLPKMPKELEGNFDHPDAFDWKLLREQLERLKRGKSIEVPRYDYKQGIRLKETEKIGPAKTVLFEGIYTLWDAPLREAFDLKVYLNVESDIRFIRRLHRDAKERSRSLDSIIRQYYDSVRPMHLQYLEPTRQFADLIVGEETDIAADVIAAKILAKLDFAGSKE